MPKLLLLWNVSPEQAQDFEEVVDRVVATLRTFQAITEVSTYMVLPSAGTFPSSGREPKFEYLMEIEVQSANALVQLRREPDYRRVIEELMEKVTDFTPLGFQRSLVAKDVMTTNVKTISAEAPFQELVQLLSRHRISGVPVVDEKKRVVGIATEADILSRQGEKVADIMSKEIIGVTEDATLDEIAHILIEKKIRRVLVMKKGRLAGIVSREDVVRALATR